MADLAEDWANNGGVQGWAQDDTIAQGRTAMVQAEYEAPPEHPRCEYVDGHLVVHPSPTGQHQRVVLRLTNVIDNVLPPTEEVLFGWGSKAGADAFIPDVMVFEVQQAGRSDDWLLGTPTILVEVLGKNRAHRATHVLTEDTPATELSFELASVSVLLTDLLRGF